MEPQKINAPYLGNKMSERTSAVGVLCSVSTPIFIWQDEAVSC